MLAQAIAALEQQLGASMADAREHGHDVRTQLEAIRLGDPTLTLTTSGVAIHGRSP